MAKTHQRVFALVAAVLFLVSSIGFSVYVIWEMNKKPDDSQSQAIQDALKAQQCEMGQEAGEAEAVPEVFKPEGDVRELQSVDLTEGTGAVVKAGDCLLVKYHGTLATTGAVFDGNFDQTTTLKVPIGTGSVIPGWDQGVIGMKEGGTRRLVIPSEQAYGEEDSAEIPANSDLVFVVKVVKIEQ